MQLTHNNHNSMFDNVRQHLKLEEEQHEPAKEGAKVHKTTTSSSTNGFIT